MRCIVKFTKDEGIKFISHLDLMRTIQRAIRRSGVPIMYSQGFNPHMIFSIAQPLAVGQYSNGEYMEIEFFEDISENELYTKLNDNMPSGIRILNVVMVTSDKKIYPNVMAALEAATYDISIKCKDINEDEIKALLKAESWEILKKSKSKEKIVDIKPMIKKLSYSINENMLNFKVMLSCGSAENLSPVLFSKFVSENLSFCIKDSFIRIVRSDMYVTLNGKYISLLDYYSRKE